MTKDKKIEWEVSGMNCNNCAANISRNLQKQGLEEVNVNFATGKVSFKEPVRDLVIDQARLSIEGLGFQVHAGEENPDADSPGWQLGMKEKLMLSLIFTLPLFLYHFLMMAGVHWPLMENPVTQLLLCLPVYIIGVWHFGRSAYFSLKGGAANMDVLIFIGSTAAFVYSVIGMILAEPDYLFFETAATIITLVLLGNWMEHRAVKQTTTAIEELTSLQVDCANLVLPNGSVREVDAAKLVVEDRVQINEGDKVPTDGILVEGDLYVDESMITGEGMPVVRKKGSILTGGTIVVSGNGIFRVSAVGKDTVLSQIIQLVEQAQIDKPEIQQLADRISGIFVPAVLLIALFAVGLGYWVLDFPFYRSVLNGIAVLVISCPCAMGLATPTAVMVGVGRLARDGILVKGGSTVETLSKIVHFVFDKTGVLTTGDFRLKKATYPGSNPEEANAIAFQMEQKSSHPIAKSLVRALTGQTGTAPLPQLSVEERRGVGLIAVDDQMNQYRLTAATHSKNGVNAIALTRNDDILATYDLEDETRQGASSLIQYLEKAKKKTYILSGDREKRVEKVAKSLGVSNYYADRKPDEKLEIIEALAKSGPTAMIGDGINDAPALAKATLGVSLSDASQVAVQSAQVILLNGQLGQLTKAVAVSKETVKTIRQNLFWAFAYNIVAIPVAVVGLLNPMFGAIFMAFSDIVVIGNSIRLKYKKISLK